MTTIIHKLRVGSFLLVHNSIIHAIGSNIHFPIVLGTPVVVYTSLLRSPVAFQFRSRTNQYIKVNNDIKGL